MTINAKDPLCNAVSQISTYFCQRTIETDIPTLSLLVLEYINGKHDCIQNPDGERHHGTHFTPSMLKQSTQCVLLSSVHWHTLTFISSDQYLRVLTALALFLIRGCVIVGGSEEGCGVSLVFTPDQQRAAQNFHNAITAYQNDEPNAKDTAADALYDLSMSVWFAPADTVDSSSWSNTWRRFFSICSLSPNSRNINPPNRIAIWLTQLKFCMKLVACHKIRSDWFAQKDNDDAVRVDESVIIVFYCALTPH